MKISDPKLFPVQAFFNAALRDQGFVCVVHNFTNHIGQSYDGEVNCNFPGDLDPGDEVFDGVEFSVGKESIVVSLEEARKYLETAIEEYLETHPHDRQTLVEMLSQN